ncbi:MAG: 16S rRNA (cytidine(1402)-2'-O)-methyltransferase [Terriglobia bacterium]
MESGQGVQTELTDGPTGKLFVVATPIGNLEDITFRAVRTLKEADLIACEDTRRTRGLLERYAIRTNLISYHEHNEMTRAPELILLMEQGSRIALVSDAGMPVISDPGYRLVKLTIRHGFPVIPIPGPCALVAALVAAGLPADRFRFLGFLPAKRYSRLRKLRELRDTSETLAFYEAPHRIQEMLEDVQKALGDRPVVIGREVTKMHEEFLRGRASEVFAALERKGAKGELTVLVGPPDAAGKKVTLPPQSLRQQIEELMKERRLNEREALKSLAKASGVSRSEIYRRWQSEKGKLEL